MRPQISAALVLGCFLAAASAQETEPELSESPELEFLEYLGSWPDEDDEWLELEQWRKDNAAEANEDHEGADAENGDEDESE